jgi:dihydropteridine reductase
MAWHEFASLSQASNNMTHLQNTLHISDLTSILTGMLAYGIAKSSTHFLVQSLAHDPTFLEKEAAALCVLPSVIDTPGNRAAMPEENFENWTKSEDIAQMLVDWVKGRWGGGSG